MAFRGALRRTYTWIAAHTPWSAWARGNTAFCAAAIPPALPVLLGVVFLWMWPRSPVPLLLALACGPSSPGSNAAASGRCWTATCRRSPAHTPGARCAVSPNG